MNPYLYYADTELVALLVQGDAQAFEMIYKRYAAELYRYARKNISARQDAEEIVQDVFEDLWKLHHKLTFVNMLKGYLYRMLRFRIVRFFRHEKVRRRYEEHYTLFEAMYITFAEEIHEPDAVQEGIERSLSQLPERCQEAVKLRLDENLSNDEIAERMNIKKTTVENYMVTALSHLRASFHAIKVS